MRVYFLGFLQRRQENDAVFKNVILAFYPIYVLE